MRQGYFSPLRSAPKRGRRSRALRQVQRRQRRPGLKALLPGQFLKVAARIDLKITDVIIDQPVVPEDVQKQYNSAKTSEEMAEKLLIRMMELDTLRDIAKNGNLIVTTLGGKDPVTGMQAAVRAANATKKPPQQPQP
ncbi:MAG: hypothetical protein KGL10_04135 [Alphaproteobacteria bacterium]|nr:hypothetical protein [Alphaproteobacteria bacterium]MDE2336477.1 hypothetical protein [Alphaproteobacteria bacterium]